MAGEWINLVARCVAVKLAQYALYYRVSGEMLSCWLEHRLYTSEKHDAVAAVGPETPATRAAAAAAAGEV